MKKQTVKRMKIILGTSSATIFVLLLVANPLLLLNSDVLLNATHSGGRASSTGVSASTGGFSGGVGESYPSGFFDEDNIFLIAPSVDVKKTKLGIMQVKWDSSEVLSVIKMEPLTKTDYLIINTPISLKKNIVNDEIAVSNIVYNIKDEIPYGVHQIPVKLLITDNEIFYETESFVTLDNTGIFPLLELFRSIFGHPVTKFMTV